MTQEFDWAEVLQNIHVLVFDINSLPELRNAKNTENFKSIVRVLNDRDYRIILVADYFDESLPIQEGGRVTHLLFTPTENDRILQNEILFNAGVLWFTENEEMQNTLLKRALPFAYHREDEESKDGLFIPHITDLLEVLNPSHITAWLTAQAILQKKREQPTKPLIIGIGGPDECGHAYFVGPLVDMLEEHEFVIEGLDLNEVLGIEHLNPKKQDYWINAEVKQWVLQEYLTPFAKGERVFIEETPHILTSYELTPFPLFLAPEMILLVWGSTLFIPELQPFLQVSILLELNPKIATARLFSINDQEDFDPSFVERYEAHDGKLYQQYLRDNKVRENAKHRIDFNNLNAFRFNRAN